MIRKVARKKRSPISARLSLEFSRGSASGAATAVLIELVSEYDAHGHPDGSERQSAQDAADDLARPFYRHCAITVPATTHVVALVTYTFVATEAVATFAIVPSAGTPPALHQNDAPHAAPNRLPYCLDWTRKNP